MPAFRSIFRALIPALLTIVLLNACGGSHGAGPAALPALSNGGQPGTDAKLRAAAIPAPGGDVVAINAGGSPAGSFAADEDYAAAGTWTYATTAAITTSGVTNPAPQAVYQDQRTGSTVTYSITGLAAGAAYTVRLSFAELWFGAAGQRVFNVSINNVRVLGDFDVFAAAGARYKAVAESFAANANSSGKIVITFNAVTNYPTINGIEIASGSAGPTPTPTPTSGAPTFNDYATFGYDTQRDVFNPNSTAITPASIPKLHVAWQASLNDYNTQTQPVLGTEIPGHAGVLFLGGASGRVYAYDALSGKRLWNTPSLGQEQYNYCGPGIALFGIGGSAAYDAGSKSLYIVGNKNSAVNGYATATLYHLDAATGEVLGEVNFTPAAAGSTEINFSHTSVTLANGIAYVGTGSTCDISSWRGRVVAVRVPAMTVANTFFPMWDPNNSRGKGAQSWGGGGIWGWGGVSLDFSGNVVAGVGNADDGANGLPTDPIHLPFVKAPHEYSGLGETLLELSPGISTILADNHPIAVSSYDNNVSNDLDVQGTPLVFRPGGAGCGTMIALQAKSGELTIYNESRLGTGYAAQYQLSPSTYDDGYLGDPSYSPVTGLVYAPVASSVRPTLFAPGLIAINPGCGAPSVAWHASFGSDSSPTGVPRSVPAASAGGVVFAGTVNGRGGDVWAVDASTGSILNGGKPMLQTSGNIRMPATIDGDWVFVIDNAGNLYGLTTDSRYPAISTVERAPDARSQSRANWFRR